MREWGAGTNTCSRLLGMRRAIRRIPKRGGIARSLRTRDGYPVRSLRGHLAAGCGVLDPVTKVRILPPQLVAVLLEVEVHEDERDALVPVGEGMVADDARGEHGGAVDRLLVKVASAEGREGCGQR